MAKREVLGLMACPECGHPHAEIKRQKCGVKLYRFCTECSAQFFARTEEQGKAMAAKIAAPSVTDTEAKKEARAPAIVPAPAATPEPKPTEKKPSAFEFLTGKRQ